jgi:predicted GIY-YIG superfamily endonuclease
MGGGANTWRPATRVLGAYKVYVLQNVAGKFYIGLSAKVAKRLHQHHQGVSNWTRLRGLRTMVWTSRSLSLTEALKLENYLKRQKGGTGFFKATGLPKPSGS